MGSNLEGLGQIPLPPLYWFSNSYYLQVAATMMALPPLKKALESLLACRRGGREARPGQRHVCARHDGARLPTDVGGRHYPGLRRGLRHVPQPARQHTRHVPPARQAAGRHRRDAGGYHRAGDDGLRRHRHTAPVHPHAQGRRRLHERRAVREVLLAHVQGAHGGADRRGHHAHAALRGQLHAAPQVSRRAAPRHRWRRTSTGSIARSSKRSAAT